MAKKRTFSWGSNVGNPESHLACSRSHSGNQSECRICIILLTHSFRHIITDAHRLDWWNEKIPEQQVVGRQDEPLEGQSLPFLDKIHFPLIIPQNINFYICRSPLCRGGGSYVSRMNFKTYCYTNFTQLNKECHWLILDCDTFEQLYPPWDTLQDVIKAWWKVA